MQESTLLTFWPRKTRLKRKT